jgi:hypothetical protein
VSQLTQLKKVKIMSERAATVTLAASGLTPVAQSTQCGQP